MEERAKQNFIWYLLSFLSFIALYTEFLSFLNLINKTSVLLGWITFLFLFILYKKPTSNLIL